MMPPEWEAAMRKYAAWGTSVSPEDYHHKDREDQDEVDNARDFATVFAALDKLAAENRRLNDLLNPPLQGGSYP